MIRHFVSRSTMKKRREDGQGWARRWLQSVNINFVPIKVIKEAIFMHHYADMKTALEGSSKLENIKHKDFRKPQKYMEEKSIENGRLAFRIRSKRVNKIPDNFKNKFKNDPQWLKCNYCSSGEVLSQSHCLMCPAWVEIREGLDMEEIKDLTLFFRRMLMERAKIDARKAW